MSNQSKRAEGAAEEIGGKIKAVYCHWDGYPEGVGNTLQLHYNRSKTKQLLVRGDISTLASDIGTKHDFDARDCGTTFYGRDRGDKGINAEFFDTAEHFTEHYSFSEYFYLLTEDGTWLVNDGRDKWERLSALLEAEDEEEDIFLEAGGK